MKNYICKECNHKFSENEAINCPNCNSENLELEKTIPMFFGAPIKAPVGAKCKDGVCTIE